MEFLHLTFILVSPITGHVIGTGGTKVVDIPVRAGMDCDSDFPHPPYYGLSI